MHELKRFNFISGWKNIKCSIDNIYFKSIVHRFYCLCLSFLEWIILEFLYCVLKNIEFGWNIAENTCKYFHTLYNIVIFWNLTLNVANGNFRRAKFVWFVIWPIGHEMPLNFACHEDKAGFNCKQQNYFLLLFL